MDLRSTIEDNYNKVHYLLTCPHCGEEVIVDSKELFDNRVLFEPKEIEYEFWSGGFGGGFKQKQKELMSSDSNKNVFHLTCCNCGKEWDEPAKGICDKRCNADGTKCKMFILNEVETERARDFIKRHNHRKDFEAQGKLGFSSLGHQFTFSITPGGLGPLVIIKCNYCGEVEDITNSDNW